MATKNFKDLPKTAAPTSIEDLQKQLAAAQAALAGAKPGVTALGVAAPAATQAPETPVDEVPIVVATGAGAPIDVAAVAPSAPQANTAPAPAPMPQVPKSAAANAVSNPTDFMSLMTGAVNANDSMNALLAAAETDSAGGKMLFPMLTQVPGTTGGAFQRVNTKNAEFNQIDLPEGKRPFTAIFIAYRYLGTCWPKGYDANNANAKPAAPLWNAAIPAAKGQEAAQLMLAGKAFQFSKDRKAFDVDAGGPGIVRPALEFLLFDQDIGLFVFRTAGHYNAAKDARDQLIACAVQDAAGNPQLQPFMGEFHPETHRQPRTTGNGQPIIHHYPRIVKLAGADSRVVNAVKAYQQFIQAASPEIRDRVGEWFNGADAPMTNVASQGIADAAAMG